jgi:Domain of unknown function (DUF4382)
MSGLRRCRFLSPMVGLLLLSLIGCSSTPMTNSSASSNSSTAPVSLSITDDPPSGVTVLFFQISLTAANLTPVSGTGTVSLLNNNAPIQIDVTQLQAISDFLSTANIAAGTYNSLALTFANPQLVIFNESDQTIANTCSVGTVCQVTPQVDNASTLTFSSTLFPLTLTAGNPLGLLLDFRLNQVIQSDLSVNLGVTNGVTIKELLPLPPSLLPPFGFLFGTIQGVDASQSQFTVQTGWGGMFTVDVNSSTTYRNFPSSACSTSELACVATGDVVQVQVASVQADNTLVVASVSYVQAASQQVVQGNVISLSTSSGSTVMITSAALVAQRKLTAMGRRGLGDGAEHGDFCGRLGHLCDPLRANLQQRFRSAGRSKCSGSRCSGNPEQFWRNASLGSALGVLHHQFRRTRTEPDYRNHYRHRLQRVELYPHNVPQLLCSLVELELVQSELDANSNHSGYNGANNISRP